MADSRAAHLAWLSLVVLVWGLSFVFIKVGVSELPAATLALLRFLVASAALLVICAAVRQPLRPLHRGDLLRLSALGLTGVTFVYLLEFWALARLTAGLGSVLASTTSMFIALFSMTFLGDRLRRVQVAGLGLGFLGVLLLVSNGELWPGDWDVGLALGAALMLASALTWAAYTIWGKDVMGRYTPLAMTTTSFVLGTLFLVPFSVVEWPWQAVASLSPVGWAAVLYLALPSSVLAYVLYNRAVKALPATDVGALLYLIPAWGVLFDTLLLGTPLTWVLVAGGALVVGGVVLVEWRSK